MKFLEQAALIETEKSSALFSLDAKRIMRITALEKDIFRVSVLHGDKFMFPKTWSIAWNDQKVPPEGRERAHLDGFSYPDLKTETTSRGWLLTAGDAAVEVAANPYFLEWSWRGKTVLSERVTGALALSAKDARIWHCHGLAKDAQFFGLGEKSGPLQKRGLKYEMRNLDAMGYDAQTTDPLYKHFPFIIHRSQGVALGLFYDWFGSSHFDLGNEIDNYHGPYFSYRAESGDLDYYLIFGPQVSGVTEKFTRLTGRPMLPPKWSLAYSGSTMTYTDAENAQVALQGFVDKINEYQIPCESFHLSSGYTSRGSRRYVFHWNRQKFPDPKKIIQDFKSAKIRLIPNIKPVFLMDHPLYQEAKEQKLFIQDSEREEPERSQFWDGKGSHLDFTNPLAFAFWQKQIQEKLLDLGIESLWNDNNEFEVWDDAARCAGAGKPWPIGWGRPIQTLLMAMASQAALEKNNPNIRPFIVSRSGMPGMQRYVQTWSGDNRTEWKTLRFNLYMALGLSLSGVSNTGHDIGGFSGPMPSPELFLRWIQHGIFYPRFVIHSWKEGGQVNEPWMYPEVLPQIKSAFALRERLRPYFYDLLKKSQDDFKPFLRPLFYDFEEDQRCFQACDQFMVGPHLMVANIMDPKLNILSVYFPDCPEGWCDLVSKKWFAGGTNVEISVNQDSIPCFVRGNSMLPLHNSDGSLEFCFYPSPQFHADIAIDFYDDDGLHYPVDERKGIRIKGVASALGKTEWSISLQKEGPFKPQYSVILVRGFEGTRLTINGTEKSEFNL